MIQNFARTATYSEREKRINQLLLAQQQVENLLLISEYFDYKKYLKQHLFKVKYELERQSGNLDKSKQPDQNQNTITDFLMTRTLSKKLTRYRLTLDVMIDNSASEPPSRWEWEKLLQLQGNEQVNDVYVENLGDYKVQQIAFQSVTGGVTTPLFLCYTDFRSQPVMSSITIEQLSATIEADVADILRINDVSDEIINLVCDTIVEHFAYAITNDK